MPSDAVHQGVALKVPPYSYAHPEELLDKAFEKLERRVVNPFNYHQLYDNVDELVSLLPYRPQLKGVVDMPERVARYGSFGVEIDNF